MDNYSYDSLGNPFRYAGYYYKWTGLYYLMDRCYHPIHDVFLSLYPEPGDDDFLTQNGYAYDSPKGLKSTLDGYVKEFIWIIVGGGVVRKVTSY